MSPAQTKSNTRIVIASFIAGMGAMFVVGLVGPVMVQGGLSAREAWAATLEQEAPAIEPLDVDAIEARLSAAEASMAQARADTSDEFARLDRLSGR